MDLEEARRRAKLALADLRALDDPDRFKGLMTYEPGLEEFPLPELVLVGLTQLCGLKQFPPAEKVRWAVEGEYRGMPFAVALQKFGFRLFVSAEGKAEVETCLHRAAKLAEAYLRDVARVQIEAGKVTIENQFGQLQGAYGFFRDKAAEAYKTAPPEPIVTARDDEGRPMAWTSDPFKSRREGGYYAGAMLEAYFSMVEHLLVLVLPFVGFNAEAGGLIPFVGSNWGDKWRTIFGADDREASRVYEELRRVKEAIRNPASHGGFAKGGASFLFHVDHVGALPALLSEHGRTPQLVYTRVPEEVYSSICEVLDQADAFLASSKIRYGVEYARSGLNVAFSPDFMAKCQEASRSDEEFEEFVEYQSFLSDMHTNMDYP